MIDRSRIVTRRVMSPGWTDRPALPATAEVKVMVVTPGPSPITATFLPSQAILSDAVWLPAGM